MDHLTTGKLQLELLSQFCMFSLCILLWWFSDESLLHLQHQHTIAWWHQAQHLPFLLPPLHLGLCPTPACTGCSGNRCWLSHVHHMDNSHIPKDFLYSHLALCKNSKLHIAIVPAHMPALKTIFCQLFKVNEDFSPMLPSKASWQWKLVSLPFFCISYDQALPTRGTTLGLWFGDCFGHTIIDKIQAVSSLS